MNVTKKILRALPLFLLTSVCSAQEPKAGATVPVVEGSKPNIVIIFTDDQGYGDLSCYGSTTIRTPHLDKLASEGTRFTSFYVQPLCGPSRSALLTGRYPARSKGWAMPASEITFAERLKTAGYTTCCIGKWDVSNRRPIVPRMPNAKGFDYYWGPLGANDTGIVKLWENNTNIKEDRDMASLTRKYTDKACEWLEEHVAQNSKQEADKTGRKPFLLYLAHTMPHTIIDASPAFKNRSGNGLYADTIEELDHECGRLLDTIDRLGLRNDTLVIFTTDNGPWCNDQEHQHRKQEARNVSNKTPIPWSKGPEHAWGSAGPLREGKGSNYEGGVRVPCLVRWPGRIPAGRTSDAIFASLDFMPTFGALAGYKVPTDRVIDGVDQTGLLLGRSEAGNRQTYFYKSGNHGVRKGKWKLLKPGRKPKKQLSYPKDYGTNGIELYNLDNDIGEKHNLAEQHPEIVKELMQLKLKANNKQERPDILFIAIDDMNDWTTVFDKNNPIKTPNLERLAARGAFFEKAYCASPGCNPSRTAIMTGLRPSTSGVYDNPYPWREILPDAVTLPKYFNQHGYRTRGAGKIFHHARTGEDDPANPSFEEFFKMRPSPRPKIRKGAFGAFDWGPVKEKLTDEFTVEWAMERMKDMPSDKPLFLAAGIFHPHLPHFAPPKFFDLYPFDQVVMPPMPPGDLDDVSQLGIDMAHRERRWSGYLFNDPPAEDDPASLKSLVRTYQASSSYADAKIGQLLDQLDATGRAENTIIVLWSDHGYHLGDKESVVKFTLWEKSSHVPFIIVAPGITKPGTRIKAPVGLVNIYPTLLDLAGLPAKPDVDGQSLVPLLKDPKAKWDPPAIINQGRGNHAVRSRDWRYIRYKDGTEELYDCKTDDPWNHTNLLAGKDKENYAAVVSEHKKWLPATEAPARDWPKKAPAKKRKKAPVKKQQITQANTSKPSPVEGGTSSEFIPETPAMPENPPETWLTYHLAHPAPEFALDPNPAFFWKGRYHLHYIYKNRTGFVFAHVSSDDMVHWEWHPTVLGPETMGHGMFSGTGFITMDGRAAMTYHGKGSGRNWISYALDDNLDKWSKPHEMTPRDKDGKPMTDMRYFDPDIWINNGIYYGVNGVSSKKPTVMMKSNNLKDWDYIGDFLYPDFDEEKLGVGRDEDISCANMFKLGDKWVLLCISHKLGCRYFIGDFKDEQFLPEEHGMMNWVDRDFFAPESLLTPDGRRVMWAWCTPRGHKSSLGKKLRTGIQTGIQSLPRELSLSEEGALLVKPLRELKKLRSGEKTVADLTVKSDTSHVLKGISGDTMELEIVLEAPAAREFGVKVLCDKDGNNGFTIASGKGSKTLQVGYIKPPFELKEGEDLTLRIFIDKNMIEAFANDRQAAVGWHDYDADDLHVSLFSKGGDLKVKSVSAWQMKSCY